MAGSRLHIAHDLSLPVDAATRTFVVFGKRGSGKSNAGVVLAEEMFSAGVPWVVLDPVDAWWGIKADGDGGPGLPVPVLGGKHGDVPLEPTAGRLIADLVVEKRPTLVLCMKGWTAGERARFVTDFAERLLARNEQPLHVFLEEADAFIPQRPFKGEERMLGVMDRLIRWGRQSGVGATAITQRSAKINKDVTTQADTLLAFRVIGPQDRDAVDAWVKYHEGGARRQEILETLATLRDGECWLWSPEFLEALRRVVWRRRRTFDSAATPKVGAKVVRPNLAEIDLGRLGEEIAATVERAKSEDPKELRKQIASLERQLAERPAADPVEVPVPVLSPEHIDTLLEATGVVGRRADELQAAAMAIASAARGIVDRLDQVLERPAGSAASGPRIRRERIPTARSGQPVSTKSAAKPPDRRVSDQNGSTHITGPQQRILDALASLEAVRIHHPVKHQVSLFAGASPRSSAFANNLGALRARGLIEYPSGGRVTLTTTGRDLAAISDMPATHDALLNALTSLIPGPQGRIVRVLCDVYPEALPKDELANAAGASVTSSAFANNLGSLRSLGVIDYPSPGYVAAKPLLFLEDV